MKKHRLGLRFFFVMQKHSKMAICRLRRHGQESKRAGWDGPHAPRSAAEINGFFQSKTLDIVLICIYNKYTVKNGGDHLDIIISNSSPRPLYEQIEEQIKNEILAGRLGQGEPMPSIRHLARELKVSVITTKRAYDDLEAEGFLSTTPGKGTFVSLANRERLREVALSQIEQRLSEAVDAARAIGLTADELWEITKTLYEGEQP